MKHSVLAVLCIAGLAVANPVVVTILNEVSVPAGGNPWLELHQAPMGEGLDLTGWRIVTGSSACTLTCSIGANEYLVIDSLSIASGALGRGTLGISPFADSVFVLPESSSQFPNERVSYPVLPSGRISAPAPPVGASIARCNIPDAWNQVINWYVDSTPTPETENDDWSEVEVNVTWDSGLVVSEGQVHISGMYGYSYPMFAYPGTVPSEGLGAGRYRVRASAYIQGQGMIYAEYPDSIDVGYSERVTGIHLHFSEQGVAEATNVGTPVRKGATIVHGSLLLPSLLSAPYSLLSLDGRTVLELRPGANDVRHLAPGVYFVRTGGRGASSRVVIAY